MASSTLRLVKQTTGSYKAMLARVKALDESRDLVGLLVVEGRGKGKETTTLVKFDWEIRSQWASRRRTGKNQNSRAETR